MPACSFCREFGHKIHNCNSNIITVYEECVKHNAAFDYYLGLKSTYFSLYLSSLNINILRAISYKRNFPLKNISSNNRFGKYSSVYKEFLQQFILYYLTVPNYKHMELINAVPYRQIIIYSQSIYEFLIGNGIHTNWRPLNISTILLSTRIFQINIQIEYKINEKFKCDNCAICLEKITPHQYCKLSCNHYFCSSCILEYIKQLYLSHKDSPCCPLCRQDITEIYLSESNFNDYVNAISNVKKQRLLSNVSDYYTENYFEYLEYFQFQSAYVPTFILSYEQFIKIKQTIYTVIRIYTIVLWIEFISICIQEFFTNANSYHNQDMLQI